MINLLVVDDHAIVRAGLKQIVAEQRDMLVAGEAESGHEALRKLGQRRFSLVILDLTLADGNGLDVLKAIRERDDKIPVLILSAHPEDQFAIRALKAGASGYLTKECMGDELITAIRKLAGGGKYITARLAEALACEIGGQSKAAQHDTLSDREYYVVCQIASGLTVGEIAAEMNLSDKTVSTYRSRALAKMNLKNNAELTLYAVRNKLVS